MVGKAKRRILEFPTTGQNNPETIPTLQGEMQGLMLQKISCIYILPVFINIQVITG